MITRNATDKQLIRWPAIIAAFVFSLNAFAKTPFTDVLSLSSNALAAENESRAITSCTEVHTVQKELTFKGWFDRAEKKDKRLDCRTDCNRIRQERYCLYFNSIRGAGSRLPTLRSYKAQLPAKSFKDLLPHGCQPISIDRLITHAHNDGVLHQPVQLNYDPPPISSLQDSRFATLIKQTPGLIQSEPRSVFFVRVKTENVGMIDEDIKSDDHEFYDR